MVGWMDDEALHRTLDHRPGDVLVPQPAGVLAQGRHLRSRPAASSAVALDCDGDALLVQVDQVGAACHTGDADLLRRRPRRSRGRRPPAEPSLRATAPSRRRDLDRGYGDDLAGAWTTFRDAGPRPAGHPGRAPAAGRRRDARRGLPQARPGPARHVPARVGRARRRLVALLDRRRRAAGPTLTERDGEALLDRRAPGRACRPAATRSRRCATPSPRCAPSALRRAAAADRRHGRRDHLRRRAPLGAAARRHAGRPQPARAHDDAGHRPGRPRPQRRVAAAGGQRRSTTTPPTSGSTRPGRTPSPGSTR